LGEYKRVLYMKGELSVAFLVTMIVGLAVLVAAAQISPTAVSAVKNASDSLSSLGIGGTIGSLILTLLFGIVIGLGLAKMGGEIFGFKIGI
jgi:hypothetical protein